MTQVLTVLFCLACAVGLGVWMAWEFWGAPLRRLRARYATLNFRLEAEIRRACDTCAKHREDTACVLSLIGVVPDEVYDGEELNLVKVQKLLRETRYATRY